MINNVRRVILGTNEFDNVEVSPNLVLDFSNQKKTTHTYTPAEGQTQGVLSHEDIFNSENISGVGGVPGQILTTTILPMCLKITTGLNPRRVRRAGIISRMRRSLP